MFNYEYINGWFRNPFCIQWLLHDHHLNFSLAAGQEKFYINYVTLFAATYCFDRVEIHVRPRWGREGKSRG